MLVFIHSPAGDVELVWSLVADVAAAVIPVPVPVVVKSVAVEGSFGGTAEPEVVVDFLKVVSVVVGHLLAIDGDIEILAVGDGAIRIFSDRVARFEAQTACHIDLADSAVVEEFHCLSDITDGAVMKASGDDTVIPAGGFDHFSAFPDVVRAGLFDKDVLSSLAGPYGGKGVPVVGGGDDDCVNVFVIEGLAQVILGGRRRALDFFKFLDAFGKEVFVNINQGFNTDIWNS